MILHVNYSVTKITIKFTDCSYGSGRKCEGDSLTFKCPTHKVITVKRGMYGRNGLNHCWGNFWHTTHCDTKTAKQRLEKYCNGKNECHFKVDNGFFGDPCGGQTKYLEYEYDCGKFSFRFSHMNAYCIQLLKNTSFQHVDQDKLEVSVMIVFLVNMETIVIKVKKTWKLNSE